MNIELEITLRCNANCPQCSRHSPLLDHSDSDMTMDQVEAFIEEVARREARVQLLSIMGGEPLLHPRFETLVQYLHQALIPSEVATLQVATNGSIPIPVGTKRLPGVRFLVSRPPMKRHRAQLVAPSDSGQATKFCQVPYTCGIAANAFGYFPCGAGGAIARLFGMHQFVRSRLPDDIESSFGNFRDALCPLCQVSAVEPLMLSPGDNPVSPSFVRALDHTGKGRSIRPSKWKRA